MSADTYLGECVTFKWSSRMCEKGTKGCKIIHPKGPTRNTHPADILREALGRAEALDLLDPETRSRSFAALTELETDRDRWKKRADVFQADRDTATEIAARLRADVVAAEADRDRVAAALDTVTIAAAMRGAERDRYREALEQAVIATNGECPLCAPLNKWGHTPSCPLASALDTPDTPPDA